MTAIAIPAPPSALTGLLQQRRSVLLELVGPNGETMRERVRLAHHEDGRHLAVRGGARSATDSLGAGDRVTVGVPVSGSVWRLTTTVLGRGASAEGHLLLAWPTGVERAAGRRFPRIGVACAARVATAEGGPTMCTYTYDVSGTGLQFAHPTALASGTALCILLACPAGIATLHVVVRWQRPVAAPDGDPMFRIGAAIQALDAASRHRLLGYLRANDHLRVEAHG